MTIRSYRPGGRSVLIRGQGEGQGFVKMESSGRLIFSPAPDSIGKGGL